jgi:lipopolysaccharide transport system ATP-binding protein
MQDVAGHGRTVLFVSHNMAAVGSLCTRGILLAGGRIEAQGSVENVISEYTSSSVSTHYGALTGVSIVMRTG